MKRSFPQLLHILIVFSSVGIGIITLGILVTLLHFTNLNADFLIILLILFIILSVFIGAYAYVMFSIPVELSLKFDKIRNKTASGKLSDINEAQREIGRFMINSFNYFGLDVTDAKVYFKGSENPEIFNESGLEIDKIVIEKISQIKKIRLDSKHKAFYIPVIFEEEELGYLLLITKGLTSPFFYLILEYFEDYFLDDYVKCLTSIEK